MSTKNKMVSAQRLLIALVFACLMTISGFGQANPNQYDKGTQPPLKSGVSEFGSYHSADIGTVNLSNGSLSIALPLGSVGGRGFSTPLMLNYSSKLWSAEQGSVIDEPIAPPWQPQTYKTVFAVYDSPSAVTDYYQSIAPGWTLGVTPTLRATVTGVWPYNCQPGVPGGLGGFGKAITKLTLTLPDKGEVELRDDLYDGAPLASQNYPGTTPATCGLRDGNRGQYWHATDGSGIIFIANSATSIYSGNLAGVAITADGTRYYFGSAGEGTTPFMIGWKLLTPCSKIKDRNGNQILITSSGLTTTFTDQLGRTTTVAYNATDPENPSLTWAVLVTLKGTNGVSRYYRLKMQAMNQCWKAGENPGGTPVYNGANDPQGYFGPYPSPAIFLFPGSHAQGITRIDTYSVLSEMVLPDGRSMLFKYNLYGEVAEVQMPTGGKIQYDYTYVQTLPSGNSNQPDVKTTGAAGSDVRPIDRAVTQRRTYPDGTNLEGKTTYTYTTATTTTLGGATGGATDVKTFDSADTLLSRHKHYFLDAANYSGSGSLSGTGYSLWSTGIEWKTETLDAAGTVLAKQEQDWAQRTAVSWSTGYTTEQIKNDNRVSEARSYLETGAFGKVQTFYDNTNFVRANNVVETKEYDFGGTTPIRRKTISYLTTNPINSADYGTDGIHLLRLLVQQSIWDGAGNEVARAVLEYDNYTADGNNENILAYATVTGHDTTTYPGGLYGYTPRGNPTSVKKWLSATNTYLTSYTRYDMLGNSVSAKDARGYVSTISYTDDYGDGTNPGGGTSTTNTYAFPTVLTSPDPGGGAHVAKAQYDFSTGLQTGFRDRNNIIVKTEFNDPFNRPTKTIGALGTADEARTRIYYAPQTIYGVALVKSDVLTASDLSTPGDETLRKWTVTDGFGRTLEGWSRDPQGDVRVTTNFDGMGRTKQVSDPYRSGDTVVWTTSVYDMQGRVTSVTTPDGAAVTTAYSGNTVTVTDQAGKKRRSETDALGRLTKVTEDPTSGGLNYDTTYLYDALDNLRQVTQGAQNRYFSYDSLSRLIRAKNVEQDANSALNLSSADPVSGNNSWSLAYTYDANGNLLTRTDARNITATNTYDALNRLLSTVYGDNTPNKTYGYDTAMNGKGRLRVARTESKGVEADKVRDNVHTAIDNYDSFGRPLNKHVTFWASGTWNWGAGQFWQSRAYNKAGAVTTDVMPSMRTVSNSYDVAGRLSSMTGNLGDGTTRTYSDSPSYSAKGQLTQQRFGTTTVLWQNLRYNVRGQLYDARVGSEDQTWGWDRGCWQWYFGGAAWGQSSTTNNGNVTSTKVIKQVNGNPAGEDWSFTTTFGYDALNRLTGATENKTDSSGTAQTYTQAFTYDRWGNRNAFVVNGITLTPSSATNRLSSSNSGISYDAAGNQTNDTATGGGARAFDAENRMTTAAALSGGTCVYVYDADGKRVKRNVGLSDETWMIYNLDGELAVEYQPNPSQGSPKKEYGYRAGQMLISADSTDCKWLLLDHLGSTRAVIGKSGNLADTKRRDFKPFGEELAAGANGRTTAMAYEGASTATGPREKFATYERDEDTGLDFAQARYFQSSYGRFLSIDPLFASGLKTDPNSWNRFTYVLNNPTRLSDPTGLIAGDYYDENGNKIGSDGKNTKDNFLVTDKTEVAAIKENSKHKQATNQESVKSKIKIPELKVRQAIKDAVDRSMKPTATDKKGKNHEEGGAWGTNKKTGDTVIANSPPGQGNDLTTSTQGTKVGVQIGPTITQLENSDVSVEGTFHVHPSDTYVFTDTKTNTSYLRDYNQPPSDDDRNFAASSPKITTNIVVGARDKTVYFYNGNGTQGTMPLNKFLNIK